MSKVKISDRQKIAALNASMGFIEDLHGSVVGDRNFAHSIVPGACKCSYGETIRALRVMRREAYDAVQRSKKDLVKL